MMARGEHQLLTEALAVAVRIRPSPYESALQPDLFSLLLHPALSRGLHRRSCARLVIGRMQIAGIDIGLVMRSRGDTFDRGKRVADFAFEIKTFLFSGAPIDRHVVFKTLSVGRARHIAGRDV